MVGLNNIQTRQVFKDAYPWIQDISNTNSNIM